MKKQLIILGCGHSSGVPRIDGSWGKCNKNKKNIRTRCSALIKSGSNSILIDTSPDIKKQFLENRIKKLSSVIFTHEHADQTNGLFELRPFFWKNKKKINIYGNKRTIAHLKRRFDYCFKNDSFYPAIVRANKIKKNFSIGSGKDKVNFNTFELKHGMVNIVVYIFENTAYISDCNDMSIIEHKRLFDLNLLILDCLKIKRNWAHFNLEQALTIQKKLNPKKTILTNLHHDLDYYKLSKMLPNNIIVAYDGLKVNL